MNLQAIEILGSTFQIIVNDAAKALDILHLPQNASILDVGTGKGYFAIFLALQGYQVLTGEPVDDQSRYANQNWLENATKVGVVDKLKFQAFAAADMPFSTESFDAVFYFGVLHHIPDNLRYKVMEETIRVTRKNGTIVFFEPKKEMLEKILIDDPSHPDAANPEEYISGYALDKKQIVGDMMDIYIYKK